MVEVDVTSAIDPKDKWVTFKLSNESSEGLNFASAGWNGGEAVPELMVTLFT